MLIHYLPNTGNAAPRNRITHIERRAAITTQLRGGMQQRRRRAVQKIDTINGARFKGMKEGKREKERRREVVWSRRIAVTGCTGSRHLICAACLSSRAAIPRDIPSTYSAAIQNGKRAIMRPPRAKCDSAPDLDADSTMVIPRSKFTAAPGVPASRRLPARCVVKIRRELSSSHHGRREGPFLRSFFRLSLLHSTFCNQSSD